MSAAILPFPRRPGARPQLLLDAADHVSIDTLHGWYPRLELDIGADAVTVRHPDTEPFELRRVPSNRHWIAARRFGTESGRAWYEGYGAGDGLTANSVEALALIEPTYSQLDTAVAMTLEALATPDRGFTP